VNIHKRFDFNFLEELISSAENMGVHIPFSEDIKVLSEPAVVEEKVIPNRIAAQPMEGCDGTVDGKPGELTYRRYKRIASGGAGLIWFEATAVEENGRANPRQLLINRENVKDLKNLLKRSIQEASKKHGSEQKPYTVLQLTHSGRHSMSGSKQQPVIAADNPHLDDRLPETFHLITDDELDELEERFVDAAIMAGEIGFDAVDIKSCHGYLNSELLSARTRRGHYGGSFENRTRFLLNIVNKIKDKMADELDITIRLSAYDAMPYPYGWGVDREDHRKYDISEPLRLVKLLEKKGIKLINISAGNPYHNPHICRPFDTGTYVPSENPLFSVARLLNISREIQQAVPGMAVVASGLSWLREFGAHCASEGISEGWFTFAGFGRQFLAYPDFPRDIFTKGRMERKKCCISCSKCSEIMQFNGKTGCVVRDRKIYRSIYRQVCEGKSSVTGTNTAD